VLANEDRFDEHLQALRDIPIVGDVRGAGYLRVVELVRDRDTRESFTDDECQWLLKGQISRELFARGLMCRTDDRAEPVLVLSPPLIAGEEEFAFIAGVLREVLTDAWAALQRGAPA
jgi:adenosylmethionine-8-amino-7-oxononanoate aminotransferase